jgi:hypothetical protein
MEVCYWALLFMPLAILHHLLNVLLQLANKRWFKKIFRVGGGNSFFRHFVIYQALKFHYLSSYVVKQANSLWDRRLSSHWVTLPSLLKYDAVQFSRYVPTLRRKMLLPSWLYKRLLWRWLQGTALKRWYPSKNKSVISQKTVILSRFPCLQRIREKRQNREKD